MKDLVGALHERAYFEWADTRDFTPRCYVCTKVIEDVKEHPEIPGATLSGIFCSPDCRAKFEEDIKKSRRSMPSMRGDVS